MALYATMICDGCETNFMLDPDNQDMPPNWMAIQIAIADKKGMIASQEKGDVFVHFCCIECAVEYFESDSFKEVYLLTDSETDEEEHDGPSVG